jgi:outer membrane protein OmpA-like peptidoglycan-associated protein
VSIPVAARTVITVEGAVELRLDDPGATGAVSLETLAGLRHVSRRGLALGVAAGPGAVLGDGTADVRAVLSVGYAPQVDDDLTGVGDRDADLVLDPNDRCPDEPAGPRPDPRAPGCPVRDQDRDGVRDDQDQCPTRPMGDDPDLAREGCPREDRDRDGVRDPDDVCPLEPAGPHPDPASRGCPHPDPDGDGILNALDACPLERGVASNDRATHGCPRVFVRGDRVVIPQQPRFAIDRDVILPVSVPLLTEVAAALEAHPELTRIEIQGHTDDDGDAPHNLNLSQRRASSIRAWLVAHGVSADRLEARGYGETVPLADNRAPGGRAMNRRVEFVVRQRTEPAP